MTIQEYRQTQNPTAGDKRGAVIVDIFDNSILNTIDDFIGQNLNRIRALSAKINDDNGDRFLKEIFRLQCSMYKLHVTELSEMRAKVQFCICESEPYAERS